MTEFYFSEFAF